MDTNILEGGEPNPYHSLLDPQRIRILEMNAVTCSNFPGAGAEVGVYHGGSLVRIAKYFKQTPFYGIDTFEGMPEPSKEDLHIKGNFSDVDFDFMVGFFKTILPNVRLIKGFFPDSIVLKRIEHNEFNFVHIDVDLYQSTKDCLEYFVPRLVLNGVLIIDDYGFPSTPGAKKAVDEFVEKLDPEHFKFKALTTGQYRIQKIK